MSVERSTIRIVVAFTERERRALTLAVEHELERLDGADAEVPLRAAVRKIAQAPLTTEARAGAALLEARVRRVEGGSRP